MSCSSRSLPLCSPSSFIHSRLRFRASLPLSSWQKSASILKNKAAINSVKKESDQLWRKNSDLVLQFAALLTTVEQPALAVTGSNNVEEDLIGTLISGGIVAFWYFIIMPPIILNWVRLRRYKRKLLEMYFQFMFVFLFFPGVLLWAPFVNFRRFPRDPSMKYPWSTPQDPLMKDQSAL